jgi:hypothetical protein
MSNIKGLTVQAKPFAMMAEGVGFAHYVADITSAPA